MIAIAYQTDRYTLTYDTETGEAITRYRESDRWSGCGPHDDDKFHADKLGITPGEHRLIHELLHHLVSGAYYGSEDTGVVFRDAHALPQTEPDSEFEEWMVTGLTYHIFGQPYYDGAAITDLEHGGVDVAALTALVRSAMNGIPS